MSQLRVTKELESDNIYINIDFNNNTPDSIQSAVFNIERNDIVIEHPNEYYLSCVRFSVPAISTPVLIFPIQSNQNNINLSTFSVTLQNNNDISREFVIYQPRNGPNVRIPSSPVTEQEIIPYYFLYNYQHLIDMINIAFINALDNLPNKPANSEPPQLVYDPQSKLFSLIVQRQFYSLNVNNADTILIYMNSNLFTLLIGLSNEVVNLSEGRDFQILPFEYLNNSFQDPLAAPVYPSTYIEIKQQFSSVQQWYAVKNIILSSNLLPARKEYVGDNTTRTSAILDFEPPRDSNSDIRSVLQYFVAGQYRLVDLLGNNSIENFDINFQWQDVYGNVYPIEVPYLQSITLKLAFFRKELFNSNFNNLHK